MTHPALAPLRQAIGAQYVLTEGDLSAWEQENHVLLYPVLPD